MSDQDRVQIVSSNNDSSSEYFDFTLPSLDLSDLHSENSETNSADNSISDTSIFSSSLFTMPNTEQLITAARNFGEIIPRFNGDADRLAVFLSNTNKFHEKYGNTEDETLNDYVFGLICSKLDGPAGAFVATRPDLISYQLLREALNIKFADHTCRLTVAHTFKTLAVHPRETLVEFIDRIKMIQTQLNLKVTADDSITAAQKPIHIQINEQTAMEVLYNNCPPLLQTLLEVKDFKTIAEATPTVIKYISKHTNKPTKPESNPSTRSFNNYNYSNTPSSKPNLNSMNFNRQLHQPQNPRLFQPSNFNNRPSPQYYNVHDQRQNTFPNRQRNFQDRNPPVTINHPQQRNTPPQRTNSSSTRIDFQRPQFRQWRQPQVNFSELDPEQYFSQDENSTEFSYDETPNNYDPYDHIDPHNTHPEMTASFETPNEENVNFPINASEN